jgi:aspartyl-tRNA(Asn)/glutamyl-tRNA(Gln) amidotransferase subunit A
MHTKTIKELSALLQGKQVSATELARHFLARAEASDLNAYTDINEELTLAQAAAADARLASVNSSLMSV